MKLIADSGSTKTDWVVMTANGDIVTQHATSGMNPIHQSDDELRGVLNLLPRWPHQIDSISFYGSGLLPEMRERMKALLADHFGASINAIEAESDLLGAARALCLHQEGIACILGTGANSCLYDGAHIINNTPALGYILGDEGSGAVIGRNFLNALYKGRLPHELRLLFEDEWNTNMTDVITHVYRMQLPNRWLASLSTFIYKYKERFPELSLLVTSCLQVFLQHNIRPYNRGDLPVSAVGSIAWFYQTELAHACALECMKLGKVIKSPIAGLINYHTSEL